MPTKERAPTLLLKHSSSFEAVHLSPSGTLLTLSSSAGSGLHSAGHLSESADDVLLSQAKSYLHVFSFKVELFPKRTGAELLDSSLSEHLSLSGGGDIPTWTCIYQPMEVEGFSQFCEIWRDSKIRKLRGVKCWENWEKNTK